MRALADVLLGQGWQLSGSDLKVSPAGYLARAGVRLHQGHAAGNLPPEAELVVHSDAVAGENPELRRAAELGIARCSYFEAVGRLTSGSRVLAVAGTHGKSTTTAMAAAVFAEAGRNPTVFCGAAPLGRSSGGRPGDARLALVEACEYRANFLHLRPQHAVILGIEPDHFDCYHSAEPLEGAYAQFARRVPAGGLVLARRGPAAVRRVTTGLPARVETFDTGGRADWSACGISHRRGRYAFEIRYRGRLVCRVGLQVPGRHNVLNALAAAALAWQSGVPADRIARGLGRFRGLRRRLELVGRWRGVLLVDDYAHHPTEVAVTLQTLRQMCPGRRIWCVFQPHQVSRTEHLLDELAESLQNADRVLVAEIFRAREGPPRAGEVTAGDLAERVRRCPAPRSSGPPAAAPEVPRVHTIDEIARLLEMRLAPGEVLVTVGAGDIRRLCDGFTDRFRKDRAAG